MGGVAVSYLRVRVVAGLLVAGLILVFAAGQAGEAQAKKNKGSTPSVTIRTTEYGIPRIVADNWRGIGYGYGYSIAKEQLCTLADTYMTVRGERSKFLGGAEGSPSGVSNLESDLFWKRIRAENTVRNLMNRKAPTGPLPEVKQTVRGYVQGFNRYLKDTGIKKYSDPRCRGKSWVKPITLLDAYHRFYQLALIASAGASMDGIVGAQPPVIQASAGGAPEEPAEEITPEDFKDMDSPTGRLGSNAVGLGTQGVKGGKGGLLLGNPHFPWKGSERFFQSQLTIPGKLNVSGASLLGVPIELIGHTRNLAWSHTVSTARRFIVFKETLVPGDPTSYVVDGKTLKMKATTVSVQNKLPDGTMETETRTLYSTIHGPVLNSVQGTPLFGWTPTTAYSIGDANSSNFRFINHFALTNRAQSSKQLLNILRKNQGVPWVNTIASDSKGNALYADIGSVPDASDERVAECTAPPIGALAWQLNRLAVFDGARPECQLSSKSPGAAAPGILPAKDQPFILRKDYVENSNDSYWFSNVDQPLEGFDRIIGEERIAQTERTRLGHKMVNEGLDSGKFTLAKLKKMEFNNRVGAAEILLDDLIAYCESNPSMLGSSGPVDVSSACPVLKNWDRRNNLDSRGSVFFGQMILNIFYPEGGGSGLPVYKNEFVFTDPIGTPSGLNTLNPDVARGIADTVTFFQSQGIPIDSKTGDLQYVVRNGKKIPMHGGGYEPVGSFNPIYGPWEPGKGVTDVEDGSSFIIAAHLTGAKCPKVNTLLTYSQSENSKSKHYADQTRLLSKKKWVTDRFCPGQQKKSPKLKVKNFGGGAKAVKKGF